MAEVRVYRDAEVLAREAAALLLEEIRQQLQHHGRATIILAGGSTPRAAYAELARLLAAGKLPADRLTWVPGDERWVAPDHPQSNERMIRETLLHPLGAGQSLLSWQAGEGEAAGAARRYEQRLAAHCAGRAGTCLGPALLGLGADGHTASLFPDGLAALPDGSLRPLAPDLPGLAVAVRRPAAEAWRLSLGPRCLLEASRIFFLVSGAQKKEALAGVLNGDPRLPASWFNREGTVFLVTRDTVDEPRLAD